MESIFQPLKRTVSGLYHGTKKRLASASNRFILYKIIDSTMEEGEERFKIQCINTKAVIHATLNDIIFDLDVLHGLHPIQGCFIGIEYAKRLKEQNRRSQPKNLPESIIAKYSVCRYGCYRLLYRNRNGQIGFEDLNDKKHIVMDPRDVALSRELIEEFDVAQAFCIGVLAGLAFEARKESIQQNDTSASYLRLVEG